MRQHIRELWHAMLQWPPALFILFWVLVSGVIAGIYIYFDMRTEKRKESEREQLRYEIETKEARIE